MKMPLVQKDKNEADLEKTEDASEAGECLKDGGRSERHAENVSLEAKVQENIGIRIIRESRDARKLNWVSVNKSRLMNLWRKAKDI